MFVSKTLKYPVPLQKTAGSIQQAKDKYNLENFDADVELKNAAEMHGLLGDKFDLLCSGREPVVYAKEADLLSVVKGTISYQPWSLT